MRAAGCDPGSGSLAARLLGARVRPAATPDLGFLGTLEEASFRDPWPRTLLLAEILHADALVLVASVDRGGEELRAGYLAARRGPGEAEILRLAVVPGHRREGIATLLVRCALDSLARSGTACFLEVREDNAAARALYGRLGFRTVGRRRAYYADGSDALVLRASLRSDSRGATGIGGATPAARETLRGPR